MKVPACRWIGGSLLLAVVVLGCSRPDANPQPGAQSPSQSPAASAPAPAPLADAWLGKWTGPEGTWLDIRRNGSAYELTVSNLDGPKKFAARPVAEGIAFEREGRTDTVRKTDGAGTGMKWLAGKSDCLVVVMGEGFCRD